MTELNTTRTMLNRKKSFMLHTPTLCFKTALISCRMQKKITLSYTRLYSELNKKFTQLTLVCLFDIFCQQEMS